MTSKLNTPKLIEEGRIALDKNLFHETIEILKPVLKSQPENPLALLYSGKANSKIGERELAYEQLKRFMHDSPDWRGKRILYYKALHENGNHATLKDLGYERNSISNNPVFISSSPRSGVNLLSGSIHHYSELPFKYSYQEGDDDQQLHTDDFIQATDTKCIISQHTRCNHRALATLQALQLRPIILVNDIFESLASYVHHIDTHKSPRTLASDWFKLGFSEKLDQVIELQAFWNLDFYASWTRAKRDNLIEYDLLTFSDLANNLAPTLTKIAKEQGYFDKEKDIEESLVFTFENADWLISKEIEEAKAYDPSHARSLFSADQVSRIEKLATLIDDIDLSPVGL